MLTVRFARIIGAGRVALVRRASLPVIACVGLLAACVPGSVPRPTDASTMTSTPTSTATTAPTATATPVPPTVAAPTPTSPPTPVAIPWPTTVIRPDNAHLVAQVSSWGKGRTTEQIPVLDGRIWIVQTPFGIYLYDTARQWELIAFLPDGKSMAVSPDETILAIAYEDASVRLWGLADGKLLRTLEHSLGRPKLRFEFLQDVPPIGAMAFSADGQSLATAYSDGLVAVWQIEDGTRLYAFEHAGLPASDALAYSPDGRFLAAMGLGGSPLTVWRLTDGKLLSWIPNPGWLPANSTLQLSPFSPDGSLLATVGLRSAVVLLHNPAEGRLVRRIGTGLEFVEEVGFTPDGTMLVILGYRISDDGDWQPITQFRRVTDGRLIPVDEVSPEQLQLLGLDSAGLPAPFEDYPVEEAPPVADYLCGIPSEGHVCGLQGIRLTADRKVVAWGSEGFGIFWWRIPEGTVANVALPETGWEVRVDLSVDGQTALACSAAGIHLVDISNNSHTTVPGGCQDGGAALIPGAATIVRWASNRIQRLSIADGQVLGAFRGHQHPVSQVVVSADGMWMASGTKDTTSPYGDRGPSEIILWDLGTRSRARTLNWWGTVDSLAFSSDAALLAAASRVGTVRIWRVADGWELKTLETSPAALAFSPDANLLATGHRDGSIRLWNVREGSELIVLSGHADGIVGLAFSPDGTALVSASWDGTVRLWGVK